MEQQQQQQEEGGAPRRSASRWSPGGGEDGPEPEEAPFVALGVALVVDQVGKGARMVFRYPAAAPPQRAPRPPPPLSPSAGAREEADDLFFRLPSRQMAKLFRPKPALCDQPLTLTVERTVFLCRSTLMMDSSSSGGTSGGGGGTGGDSSNDPAQRASAGAGTAGSEGEEKAPDPSSVKGSSKDGEGDEDGEAGRAAAADEEEEEEDRSDLALFSVIVALVARPGEGPSPSALPITSWVEGGGGGGGGGEAPGEGRAPHPSASFLSVRRAHVSLSRLCRVLAREERRCRYVSAQAELFRSVRAGMQRSYRASQEQQLSTSSAASVAGATPGAAGGVPSGASVAGTSPLPGQPPGHGGGHHHRRTHSFGRGELLPPPSSSLLPDAAATAPSSLTAAAASTQAGDDIVPEIEQDVVETIMASGPGSFGSGAAGGGGEDAAAPTLPCYRRGHLGNLARELAQVYHALARNDRPRQDDDDLAPSPSDLLTGRNGIVYVNRHVAVAVEPLSLRRSAAGGTSTAISPLGSGAAASAASGGGAGPAIRPYHTLLFPLASPAQLLEALRLSSPPSDSGSGLGGGQPSDFRRLQQLLLAACPRRDLRGIAADAGLPLSKAVDLARYLASQGACVGSPALGRDSRFGCGGADRIFRAALPFSQAFGPAVNLFSLAGFLAADGSGGRTLGESAAVLASSLDPQVARLREELVAGESSPPLRDPRWAPVGAASSTPLSPRPGAPRLFPLASAALAEEGAAVPCQEGEAVPTPVSMERLEDALCQMAAWLLSRGVLRHRLDFLVAASTTSSHLHPRSGGIRRAASGPGTSEEDELELERGDGGDSSAGDDEEDFAERKHDAGPPPPKTAGSDSGQEAEDEALFRELLGAGLLDGRTSLHACCWRLGWEASPSTSSASSPRRRLLAWAGRHPRVRVASREPTAADEW